MLLHIPDVLTQDEVRHCRRVLDAADWVDGAVTAGFQSVRVKNNTQLPEGSAEARELGEIVLAALNKSPLFASAALPAKVFPPLFNRYEGGQAFGNHVDNAIRQVRGGGQRLRTDISATLFLSAPEEYDGGELVVDDTYGPHAAKLPAGHLVLYPASSLHRVTPVARGARLASFFWIQSLVRDDAERTLLFDMDMAIIRLRQQVGDLMVRFEVAQAATRPMGRPASSKPHGSERAGKPRTLMPRTSRVEAMRTSSSPSRSIVDWPILGALAGVVGVNKQSTCFHTD